MHWVQSWVKTAGDALQHGALAASVFAGDHQNSEKTARHFVLIKERTEHAEDPRPQMVARCSATDNPSSD